MALQALWAQLLRFKQLLLSIIHNGLNMTMVTQIPFILQYPPSTFLL
jgi:hypothetical protein